MNDKNPYTDIPKEELDELLDIINDLKKEFDFTKDFGAQLEKDNIEWIIYYTSKTKDIICFKFEHEDDKTKPDYNVFKLKL